MIIINEFISHETGELSLLSVLNSVLLSIFLYGVAMFWEGIGCDAAFQLACESRDLKDEQLT